MKSEDEFEFEDEDTFLNLDFEEAVPLKHSATIETAEKIKCVNDGHSVAKGDCPDESKNSMSISPSYSLDCSNELEISKYFDDSFESKEDLNNTKPTEGTSTTNLKCSIQTSVPVESNFTIGTDEFDDSDDDIFSKINLDEGRNSQTAMSGSNTTASVGLHNQGYKSNQNASSNQGSPLSGQGENISKKVEFTVPTIIPTSTPRKRHNFSSCTPKNALYWNEIQSSNNVNTISPTCDTDSGKAAFERFTNSDSNSVYRLKRRFPGPAGLLPTISPKELKLLNQSPHPLSQQFSKIIAEDSSVADKEVVALQGIIPGLESISENEQVCLRKAPWKEMLKQLNMDVNDDMCPMNFMNVKWIRTKALKLTTFFKIPFLLAVLQEAPEIHVGRGKVRLKNPSVKLIDATGSIFAAMDAAVIASFGEDMFPGTAIALRNIGLLRFKRQVILTITIKNLVCITSCVNEKIGRADKTLNFNDISNISILPDGSSPTVEITTENVKITKFSAFNSELVMKEYNEITSMKMNSFDEMYGCNEKGEKSPVLFTNIRNIQNNFRYSVPVQRHLNTSVPLPVVNLSKPTVDDMSAFDDDDDELFQALDNIDFGDEDL